MNSIVKPFHMNTRLMITFITIAFILSFSTAHATIHCAGYLPSSYFERVENNQPFAGKLVEQADGTQQLQELDGRVITKDLRDAYVVMDKYVIAKQHGKYGVINAAGKIIIPFKYDTIQTEPDIATSFMVGVNSADDENKQGIIDRHGEWIYSLADVRIEHAHYDSDYDQDYFKVTNNKGLTGLLDDRGYWAIMPQYEALRPLNACTGQPLYLQVSLKDKTALIAQNNEIIIPFAADQHIEAFNSSAPPLLFLRSTLTTGSTATGMSEDMQDKILSAQIIDTNGKPILSSEAPIRKLLYHQLYTYKRAGKFGIVDHKGDVILKPQFDSYRDDADKVWVEKNGKMRRLNTFITLD
ncbi:MULTISPECIES: WG repeat-containing protein [unclassified Psychrobacter]|uniref:WG repeat-containing protein n=1 Tax=unclassified Psychrobacter TaxID=196806 RepID=UPI0025D1E14B|nr:MULTISPECIES: WG repeat-containing protein [unclassified Psychrobacter]